MRSILTILFSVILSIAAVMLLHPGQRDQVKTKNSLQTVLERGSLRCGYASYEPMMIIDPNTKKLSGISYEIMTEIGKKLGVTIDWVEETSWGDYPTSLANNRFDAMCALGWPNAKRARMVQFTRPVLYAPVNIYVRADEMRPASSLNNPGFKFVYIDGTTPQLVTNESFPEASHYGLPELTSFSSLFMDIKTKKADATIIDSATANYFIKTNPGTIKIANQGKALRVFPDVFAVKQGDYELQQALDMVLAELNNAGIIDRIIRKYEPLPDTYYRVKPGY